MAVLRTRSLGWAYTKLNLGIAADKRRGGGRAANLRQAIHETEEGRRGAQTAGDRPLLAHVEHNLFSMKATLAGLEEVRAPEADRLMTEAELHARASLRLRPLEAAPIAGFRTLSRLGDLQKARGDDAGATSTYRRALDAVPPDAAPRIYRRTARSLADLAEENGDWELAADAWTKAVAAAVVAFESRASIAGRLDEAREDKTLFRFAGYALARAGRPERAAEVVELGRARELTALARSDLIDLDRLRYHEPALARRFEEGRARLEDSDRAFRSGIGTSSAELGQTADAFREVVEQIRQLPGFEDLLTRPTLREIAAAARDAMPLLYFVSAPRGSGVLVVWGAGDAGEAGESVEFIDCPDLTSRQLASQLFGLDDAGEPISRVSYMSAQAGDTHTIDEALVGLSATLGESLLHPLANALNRGGAKSICILATGLLGLLPLHAIAWRQDGQERCLLDEFAVAFAPSGSMRSICLRRVEEGRPTGWRLLAVGNPQPTSSPPLDGSEYEAQAVAALFGDSEVLLRERATKRAVLDSLGRATHVHLACHGLARFDDELLTAMLLLASDEPLSAREILDLNLRSARLVVASACQTAVIQDYDRIDEAFGLAAVFLAGGAAGAIASLWPVDDLATSLLMIRFYELLIQGNESPHAALRDAALWLRGITDEAAKHYIAQHPILRRQQAAIKRTGAGAKSPSSAGPYSSPSMWAAFTVNGA